LSKVCVGIKWTTIASFIYLLSIKELRDRWEGLTNDLTELLWDKDDSSSNINSSSLLHVQLHCLINYINLLVMQFVTAAANLRAYAFGIPASNLFEIKGCFFLL
jgi:hypothetical protein